MDEIKKNLRAVIAHGSGGARYIRIMLNVLAIGGFSPNDVFPVFMDLFDCQQLASCRWTIVNIEGHLWLRGLSHGLEYKLTCISCGTCKGSGRKSILVWPLPGADEEYSMTDFCLF